jgi:hypothetical protein
MLYGEGFVSKFINSIIPLFAEGRRIIREVMVINFGPGHKVFKEVADGGILKILVIVARRLAGLVFNGVSGGMI